jgi:hypothetical protein
VCLDTIISPKFGEIWSFLAFVTVVRFEASNIKITGQAFYLCDAVSQAIGIEI